MKNYLKTILSLLVLTVSIIEISTSCSKSDPDPLVLPTPPAALCSSLNTSFQNIFGSSNNVLLDFDVHSYEFKVNANKTICSIGYQSTAYNANNPYTIKIKENGVLIYNQPHIFSATQISYVPVGINLTAGKTYSIERIQTNSGSNNRENVGRYKPATFPVSTGALTITGSDFYFVSTNGTAVSTNTYLPFIDIVFQ